MIHLILILALAQTEWKPIFNGKDLDGWETWLAKPGRGSEFEGLKKNEKGDYVEPLGLNRDPHANFSVVTEDGAPALRVSGEVFGGISTKDEFENYHFRAEFKWGQKRWPPREKTVRDNGLLYHCVGPHGAGSGAWLKSFEMQIQEHDCGDFHSVAGVVVDVEAVPKDPGKPDGELRYRKGAPKVAGVARRIWKDPDNEKPSGEWNLVEIYCLGQTSVHVVNGKVVMVLTNLRHKVGTQEVALTKGRLQIQSEAAEIFWRKMELRPISELPRDLLE
ncbi:MAG: DUF1080 domain-containing protein [Planctomycetaceae bacterium]|nr:DUF1080 domain-containing protein [Planctomycetaceae bacterium]